MESTNRKAWVGPVMVGRGIAAQSGVGSSERLIDCRRGSLQSLVLETNEGSTPDTLLSRVAGD
jgi:hypothetical protein